jgi:hypothetical protein
LLSELGFNSKRAAFSGTTKHGGALVASGANSCLRDLGGLRSPISTDLSDSDSELRELVGKLSGILRLPLPFVQFPNQNWQAPDLEIYVQACKKKLKTINKIKIKLELKKNKRKKKKISLDFVIAIERSKGRIERKCADP